MNTLGFRAHGLKGMRICDFGWVESPRGWGSGALGKLRLQMQVTDPLLAEPELGTAQSEGRIRLPATLDTFIDRHGWLDEACERQSHSGVQPGNRSRRQSGLPPGCSTSTPRRVGTPHQRPRNLGVGR